MFECAEQYFYNKTHHLIDKDDRSLNISKQKGRAAMKILKQTDLYELLPFKKTKIQELIRSGQLPLVKIGKDYITTEEKMHQWIDDHIGQEIFF